MNQINHHDKVIQHYLVNQHGFNWGILCENWIMYNIWEPQLLEKMQHLTTMRPGQDTNILKRVDLWNILNLGFKTFEFKLDSIIRDPNRQNYVMVKTNNKELFIHSVIHSFIHISG
jgi:hypothetical protein